ncbi:transcription factor IIF subunit [Pichia kluyveri]|uniref:Transcription initiation factor IIF subunit beta n=1 Tax=Pichia kluyveri TaxID=36015 RepID=A0AAV5R1K8_PICKL|nr:transcription factor IIF subunit [Pichia kluyveri]
MPASPVTNGNDGVSQPLGSSTTNNDTNSNNNITNNTDNIANNDINNELDDSTNVAYDQDDLPIPQGIVDVNIDQLDQNESVDLDLSNSNKQIWLVRLTPQLAELWRNDEFLNGQLLGNIKIPKTSFMDPNNNNNNHNNNNNNNNSSTYASPQQQKNNKILLDLNKEIPEHKNLESQYELKLIKQVVDNEYAFSESQFKQFRKRLMYRTQVVNMPVQPKMRTLNKEALNHEASWTRKVRNYKKEAQFREMMARDPNYKTKRSESGMGTTYLSDDDTFNPNNNSTNNNTPSIDEENFDSNDEFGSNSNNKFKRNNNFKKNPKFEKFDKFKKFIPYAKTIPKKTELIGKIVHECQVIPTKLVADNKLRMLEQRRRLSQMAKKKTINYMKSEAVGIMHGRTTPNIQTGSTITLSKELAMKKEAAKQDGRNARLDRDVLMNILFKLFNEYEYWTLKGLREKTNQPEIYLKECIESIAVMERKGPYALKWRLKDEYKKSIDVEKKVKRGSIEDDEDADIGKNSDNNEEEDDDMNDVEMEDIAAV